MEILWWLLVLVTMVVYPVVLVRSAVRGRRWALDTLEAMRYLGGDMMTTSVWRSLPPEPERVRQVQGPVEEEQEQGRLVA